MDFYPNNRKFNCEVKLELEDYKRDMKLSVDEYHTGNASLEEAEYGTWFFYREKTS